MMDFLLEHYKSALQINSFLSDVFECSVDSVKTFSLSEFNCLTEELDNTLNCICVSSSIQGDASQLLQLYRYKINISNVVNRIIGVALKNKIRIYGPDNSFDAWIYICDGKIKHVRQIESDEDNRFIFEANPAGNS